MNEVQLVFPNIMSPVDAKSITAVGWQLPDDLTQSQWQDCGKVLQRIDGARQWWIGDWWNAGVKWGDGQKICEELDIDYQTARNCGKVARRFELYRRRYNLSFRHHDELCSLDETAVQDRFLDWCEEPLETDGKPRSIRALRQAIKEHLEMRDWPDDERERRRIVTELSYPTLANHHRDTHLIKWAKFAGCHVYIGRGSAWGNPFELDKDGDRDYVIESFGQYYFPRKPSLLSLLPSLMGKVLECYCFPQPCHGEVLIESLKREAWELLNTLRETIGEEEENGGNHAAR